MRRTDKSMSTDAAWALFRAAPVVHLATTGQDGRPLLRTVHGVVVDGALCFHGARKGEKTEALGRPVVASAEEILAAIPSWFVDPQRACPATTLYRSAMLHGVMEDVADSEGRARILQALMERYQPEGGYQPITAADPLYSGSLRGVRVVRIRTEAVQGKAALGQHWPAERRAAVVEQLWARGEARDLPTIQRMLEHDWQGPLPAFLAAPDGAQLVPDMASGCHAGSDRAPDHAPHSGHLAEAVALLRGRYWTADLADADLARGHAGSSAWVGAVDGDGRVIASARAIADGARLAYVMDVAVADSWRGRGLGRAVMRLLLDHPAVRGCRRVELHTRDAGPFYTRLGFSPLVDPPWREGWRLVR